MPAQPNLRTPARSTIALLTLVACCVAASFGAPAFGQDFSERLEAVVRHVEARFYRPPDQIPDYPQTREQARLAAARCGDEPSFRRLVQVYLRGLGASHTYYLTPDDWEYYHLAAVFESLPAIKKLFNDQPITLPTLGVIWAQTDQGWQVRDVFRSGPADEAGLRIGDHVLTIDREVFHPITALRSCVDRSVPVTVLRGSKSMDLSVTPRRVQPRAELLEAMRRSVQVETVADRRIGYIHAYSYAGREYQDVLEEAIAFGDLAEAEALVVDLRYGLGGANPSYLNVFNQAIPRLEMKDQAGATRVFDGQWRKPAVLLVNETSRSGKEVLAYGARKYGLAKVVGTRTAGAVLGGSPIVLDNRDLLYLAVQDVLVDGERLEGVGVEPELEVRWAWDPATGEDLQRKSALRAAADMVPQSLGSPRDE